MNLDRYNDKWENQAKERAKIDAIVPFYNTVVDK